MKSTTRSVNKVYEYANCSTCKAALKYLDSKNVPYVKIPIVVTPPTATEIQKMIGILEKDGKSFKNLFNTSGVLYREMEIAKRLKNGLTATQAVELLSKNGKLIKRPFLLTEKGGSVGFKEEIWKKLI